VRALGREPASSCKPSAESPGRRPWINRAGTMQQASTWRAAGSEFYHRDDCFLYLKSSTTPRSACERM
jgi:hypothetical protein